MNTRQDWHGALLLTDEESRFPDQGGQVFVLQKMTNELVRGYCITKPMFWGETNEWAKRSDILKHFGVSLKSSDTNDPLASHGGDDGDKTAYYLHDPANNHAQKPIFYDTTAVLGHNVLHVAELKDTLESSQKHNNWPLQGIIVIGYTEFSHNEISQNIAEGRWFAKSTSPYPFVVFAPEMAKKYEVAKQVLREFDGHPFSFLMQAVPHFDDIHIGAIKSAAKSKAESDTNSAELAEITRQMIRLEMQNEQDFFSVDHENWQEKLEGFKDIDFFGKAYDGMVRTPKEQRYDALEAAYEKLGYDPRWMEFGFARQMNLNMASNSTPPNVAYMRDPTRWGQALDMIKSLVKDQDLT